MALENKIEEVASGPQKVSGDEGSVEMPSISELIKADKYLSSIKSVEGRTMKGLKFFRIIPPSAV